VKVESEIPIKNALTFPLGVLHALEFPLHLAIQRRPQCVCVINNANWKTKRDIESQTEDSDGKIENQTLCCAITV